MPPRFTMLAGLSLVVAAILGGCGRQEGGSDMKTVSIAELGEETNHLLFFSYVGSDADFHYFTTTDDKQYRVARSEWNNPAAFPTDGTMQFFVTVKDGKLTVPDPKEMSKLSNDELMRPEKRP